MSWYKAWGRKLRNFFLFEIENPTHDDEDISPLLDTFIEVIFFIRALIQLHLNHTFAI